MKQTMIKAKWIIIGVLSSALISGTAFSAPSAARQDANTNIKNKTLPIDDLQRFTNVIEHIRNYYVKPASDKELFEHAIEGMLSGLDPHSAYLDPSEFSDLKASTTGKFGGLGIEVTMDEGYIKVISPIDGTPAMKAGVKAGDTIIKLDETPVKGLSLRKAVDLMRGEKGTPITLTIIRKDETKPLSIKVVRDIIKVKSVKKDLLDENFGYIKISQFQTRTGEDVIAAVNELKKETNNQLKGIILDLRNNPGGILDASVKVSDAFLNKASLKYNGLIVYTEGRLPGSQIREAATPGDVLDNAPIVVLINGGSASASEIVAGALQDHKRAVILGTSSFGKGSVQTVLPLKDNHGLKLTTALYYTPSGRSIQAKGIQPDIVIETQNIKEKDNTPSAIDMVRIKEKDLTGHIEQPKNNKKSSAILKNTKEEDHEDLIMRDYQLNEALNILKGLTILSKYKS